MNTQTRSNSENVYSILSQTQRLRISDGEIKPVLDGCSNASQLLVLIWSQLGDFDNLEYTWWLRREREKLQAKGIVIRAIGIGDRNSGIKFCNYTQFPQEWLFVDSQAEIHKNLQLYQGLNVNFPMLSTSQKAWLNLMLMCAGIGSPGTLGEVFRGYKGDKKAPQLIADEEVVRNTPLPPIKGSFFKNAGGKGFQRPFELATLRLRNMTEVLSNWNTYVPDSAYLTQRGATFLFDSNGKLIYEHRDRGILGFAENMSNPLSFLLDS
ncbi:peroxiredoxin-like family protein [Rivularia sp. UHCC 0363]|uniref:peroxiredoxin-like family protein n=1 Tax=Rivularia sp. UHCC 0363 TaxID=3110244 RepID=UPI002B1EC5D0|nr:peroxiredoxin-like family protein [Rivularia sp. UHCC 0363]MEA5595194.1 peroxiredoxin-like family protein [Rivularia sp. UHCC 0363]